jgi:hypothetical protein
MTELPLRSGYRLNPLPLRHSRPDAAVRDFRVLQAFFLFGTIDYGVDRRAMIDRMLDQN